MIGTGGTISHPAMETTILTTLAIALLINVAVFVPAYLLRTDKLTDITYALTFVALALYGLVAGPADSAHRLLFVLVCVWAARLGGYLLLRIHSIGRDARFDDRRGSFLRFGAFWLLQGVTVWVVMLPSTFFFARQVDRIPAWAFIGFAVWLAGLVIETIADAQKYRFRTDPRNEGRWIEHGLWRYSRHPNYLGEIMLWTGVYLYTLSGLSIRQALVGAVGPVYLALLIILVSGIPILEKRADERWGGNEAYRRYRRRTGVLLPLP